MGSISWFVENIFSLAQEKVVNLCNSFRQLKSMGFTPAHVVGALVLHADDIAAATEACLSCQA